MTNEEHIEARARELYDGQFHSGLFQPFDTLNGATKDIWRRLARLTFAMEYEAAEYRPLLPENEG